MARIKKIEIRDFATSKIIFEFEKENNTIKDTVLEAINNGVSLHNADLHGADLHDADLYRACLSGAYLRGANLREANLHNANLLKADLYGAYLRGANLHCANLHCANLNCANLREANLHGAQLNGANLLDADLHCADLHRADLRGAKNIPFIAYSCPSSGSFVGWKKISRYKENYKEEFLVKLLIPEDARRCSATTDKCRCNKAKVLEIRNIETDECVNVITNTNIRNAPCTYKVGEMVYPDSFDEDRWNECSHGIHFFTDKQLAIDYLTYRLKIVNLFG